MARVNVTPAVLADPKPPVVKPASYTLELSAEEMAALFALTRVVGGDPDDSPRGLTERINEAILRSVPEMSAACGDYRVSDLFRDDTTSIYFDRHTRHSELFTSMVEAAKRKV